MESTMGPKESSTLVQYIETHKKPLPGALIKYVDDEDIREYCEQTGKKPPELGNGNGPRVVFVAVPDEENQQVNIGYCVRSPKDKTVDKHFSLGVAENRARTYFNKTELPNNSHILNTYAQPEFKRFIEKCKNWKSFQNKRFPNWINNI